MSKCALILAGGEGKRMHSDKPKTLCEVLGKPMLRWVIDSVRSAGISDICVVKGFAGEYIDAYLATLPFDVDTAFQAERLGTGHAVMMARDFLHKHSGSVVILGGDAPFMDAKSVADSYEYHISHGASATVISAIIDDPTGYGRIVRAADNALSCIVEHKDASDEIRQIKEVNSGGYWFETDDLLSVLDRITSDNKAREYYLPDAVKLLLSDGKTVTAFTASSADTVLGANDPDQLRELENIARLRGYTCD